MPLVMSSLRTSLEQDWLSSEGGSHPATPLESGDAFAGAVASWFASAQALGIPCSTAQARRPQLAAQAAGALRVQDAIAAGNALAVALGAYVLGQLFGAGTALMPIAVAAGGAQIGAVFADLQSAPSQRAQSIAAACTVLAVSTLVSFPNPPFVGNVV